MSIVYTGFYRFHGHLATAIPSKGSSGQVDQYSNNETAIVLLARVQTRVDATRPHGAGEPVLKGRGEGARSLVLDAKTELRANPIHSL